MEHTPRRSATGNRHQPPDPVSTQTIDDAGLVSPALLLHSAREYAAETGARAVSLVHLLVALGQAAEKTPLCTWPHGTQPWFSATNLEKLELRWPSVWALDPAGSPGTRPPSSSPAVERFANWEPTKRRRHVRLDQFLRKVLLEARAEREQMPPSDKPVACLANVIDDVWRSDRFLIIKADLEAIWQRARSCARKLAEKMPRLASWADDVSQNLYVRLSDRVICGAIDPAALKQFSSALITVAMKYALFENARVNRRLAPWPREVDRSLAFAAGSPDENDASDAELDERRLKAVDAASATLTAHEQAYLAAMLARPRGVSLTVLHDGVQPPCGLRSAHYCRWKIETKLRRLLAPIERR
jgi:hypothetical protein